MDQWLQTCIINELSTGQVVLNMYNQRTLYRTINELSTGPMALNMYNQLTLYRTSGFKHV